MHFVPTQVDKGPSQRVLGAGGDPVSRLSLRVRIPARGHGTWGHGGCFPGGEQPPRQETDNVIVMYDGQCLESQSFLHEDHCKTHIYTNKYYKVTLGWTCLWLLWVFRGN